MSFQTKINPVFCPVSPFLLAKEDEIVEKVKMGKLYGADPVSYTHLDVYKRQTARRALSKVGLMTGVKS